MRKKVLAAVIFVLVIMSFAGLAANAQEVLYAAKSTVDVYFLKSKKSGVQYTLYGGQEVYVNEISDDLKWAEIIYYDPRYQDDVYGWVRMSNMSYVMPSNFCNHQWSEWEVITPATCTQSGLQSKYCYICGVGQAAEIPATGHNYGQWNVTRPATCISEGEMVCRCQTCGAEYRQVIEKTAHDYGPWTETRPATCTQEGERVCKCRVCGNEFRQTIERLPHTFSDWTVTKNPTCTEEGSRYRVCSVCKFQETQALKMIPHDFEWKIVTEPTDHSAGNRSSVCKVCGYVGEQQSFDPEGTLRRGASGDEVREVQQLLIDQKYLNEGGADGIFGGGTEKAVMTFQTDQKLTADGVAWPQTIKRLQHEFGPWETVKKVTREEPGERRRICKDCGFEQQEEVTLSPTLERGARGDHVRAVQQMFGTLGYEVGSYDGIYGKLLDAAFAKLAEKKKLDFEEGRVMPVHIDALVNEWLGSVPKEKWNDGDDMTAPVNLALTVTPLDESEDMLSYQWGLTNLGSEPCVFTVLLMNHGEEPDFSKDNYVMQIDGFRLEAECNNAASGKFTAAGEWGKGAPAFCAVAASEASGDIWLSNVCTFAEEEETEEVIVIGEIEAEEETEAAVEEETETAAEDEAEAETEDKAAEEQEILVLGDELEETAALAGAAGNDIETEEAVTEAAAE